MQPKQQNMAHELVVLKSDLKTLFVDGAIDSNIIDASFFIMSENEAKMGQEQNLYLPSFLFVSVNKFIYNKFLFVNFINSKKGYVIVFRMTSRTQNWRVTRDTLIKH